VELTKKILSINSKTHNEKELVVFIKKITDELGFKTELVEHSDTSASFFAVYGEGPQKLCINCHLDTVPYINNPLREDEHYIYGEGAVDTKKDIGPLLSALSNMKKIPNGLVLAFDADEEYINTGMKAIKDRITAPTVIVNEPTNMEVHVGFRGWTEVVLEARGSQVHSCYARRDDAYSKLVNSLSEGLKKKFKKKDSCGECGFVVNSFPNKSKMDVFIPPTAKADLLILNNITYNTKEIVQEQLKFENGTEARIESFWPAFLNKKSVVGKKISKLGGGLKRSVHKAWTNANYFVNRDVVIFGMGDPIYGHTNDEKVEKQQIVKMKEIYEKLLKKIN
jgi:acetylornithine deacetylase/succinyl-diaminopimelate desuccinylase-like protein